MGSLPLFFIKIAKSFNFGVIDSSIDLCPMGFRSDMLMIVSKVFLADRAIAIFLVGPGEELDYKKVVRFDYSSRKHL